MIATVTPEQVRAVFDEAGLERDRHPRADDYHRDPHGAGLGLRARRRRRRLRGPVPHLGVERCPRVGQRQPVGVTGPVRLARRPAPIRRRRPVPRPRRVARLPPTGNTEIPTDGKLGAIATTLQDRYGPIESQTASRRSAQS